MRNIPPNETGQIKIEFNTKGRHGRISQGIDVRSNDPLNRLTRLTVTGTIIEESQYKKGDPNDEVYF